MADPKKFALDTPSLFSICLGGCLVSLLALIISTVLITQQHGQQIATAQREVNGNNAMIFAVCRAFRRRDAFEQQRIDAAKSIELRHEAMTKPFSPIVKDYFHDRRAALITTSEEHERKFVYFNCIRGMERAYLEGYKSQTTPGKPLPTPTASPKRSVVPKPR